MVYMKSCKQFFYHIHLCDSNKPALFSPGNPDQDFCVTSLPPNPPPNTAGMGEFVRECIDNEGVRLKGDGRAAKELCRENAGVREPAAISSS